MRETVIGNLVSSNQNEYWQRKCRDLKTHGLGHELLNFNNEMLKFEDKFYSFKSKNVLNLLFQNVCMLFLSIQKEAVAVLLQSCNCISTSDHLALGKQLEVWVFSNLHMHFVQSLLKKYLLLCRCCHFSHVQLFATPWTVVFHAPLPMGILEARILEWVVMPSSRGSSRPRYGTCVSCIGRQVSYHWHHLGSPSVPLETAKVEGCISIKMF